MIEQLRFRLIWLIGLLYRHPENKTHFRYFFSVEEKLLIMRSFWVFGSDVVGFYSIWILLCSHHAKRTTQLLSRSQSFPVFCLLMLIVAHKIPNRFITWRNVCERAVEQTRLRTTLRAHAHDGYLNWISRFLPTIWNVVCYTSIIQPCLFRSNLFLSFSFQVFFSDVNVARVDTQAEKRSAEKWRGENKTE